MVKDTGSRYFDSAYFVIKSDLPASCKDSDMLSEAHKMIDAYSTNQKNQLACTGIPPKPHQGALILWILAAAIIGIISLTAIVVIKLMA